MTTTVNEIILFIKELQQDSNVVSKIDVTKDTSLPKIPVIPETITSLLGECRVIPPVTISIRSKSHPTVPSFFDLHLRLINKFKNLKCTHELFYKRESLK